MMKCYILLILDAYWMLCFTEINRTTERFNVERWIFVFDCVVLLEYEAVTGSPQNKVVVL
jgi:hypothetical protein